MRSANLLAILLATLCVLGSCGQSKDAAVPGKPAPGAKASKGTIALSMLTLTNPFFKDIADSMTAEAAKHGYGVLVVSGEFDVARQQNQVKDFIVKKVSAIVLTPCDSKAIGPVIQEANDASIPVFTADIACLAQGVDVVSHIATDNYQGGRLAAKAIADVTGGRGKVAIIDFPVVESVILRTNGFIDELTELNENPDVDIEIVAVLPGGGAKDVGFKAGQDLLQSHPDIDAVFAINDPSGLGVLAAFEEAGKAGEIPIVAFDGLPEGKQAIKDGMFYADPVQFPDRIGVETVQAIMKHFEGEEVPKEILIPTALYYKADAEKDPALGQ